MNDVLSEIRARHAASCRDIENGRDYSQLNSLSLSCRASTAQRHADRATLLALLEARGPQAAEVKAVQDWLQAQVDEVAEDRASGGLRHEPPEFWHQATAHMWTLINYIDGLSTFPQSPSPVWQPTGVVAEIQAERVRQKNVEGWTDANDDKHSGGEMAIAAGWYALNSPFVGHPDCIGDPSQRDHEAWALFWGEDRAMNWPWAMEWWKPKDTRRDLVRAAALIVAEIERLDRATPPAPGKEA